MKEQWPSYLAFLLKCAAVFIIQFVLMYVCLSVLGDPEVTANIDCKSRNFPIQMRKITVQICGNFWVIQYVSMYGWHCITLHVSKIRHGTKHFAKIHAIYEHGLGAWFLCGNWDNRWFDYFKAILFIWNSEIPGDFCTPFWIKVYKNQRMTWGCVHINAGNG